MKEDDFADWYLDIVEKANLSDKRYPIKGMNVWTPYGWKIMRPSARSSTPPTTTRSASP